MSPKLHFCLLTLVSIFLLFVASTLNPTSNNAKPVFVYDLSPATPEHQPLPFGPVTTNRQAAPKGKGQACVVWVDINAAPGGDGSEAAPFNALQLAIDAAVAGELIVIRPGVYGSAPVVMKDVRDGIGVMKGTTWHK